MYALMLISTHYRVFVHLKIHGSPRIVLFRANSVLQGTLGVLGTTSRYKEPTVDEVYVA